jgi:hypothetical protein
MDLHQLAASNPADLGRFLAGLPRADPSHHGPPRSVREDDFEGHHIVITTTYEITVDSKPLAVHIGLSNDGSAHCHGLPAYQFVSVVDLVRSLITYFPEEFTPGGDDDSHHHGDHDHAAPPEG